MEQLTKEEKRRAYNREYYEKNRERILEYRKKWVAANKDSVIKANAKYYAKKLQQGAENNER